ncbi:MAG: hypothetical protein DRP33_05055 [Thermotogae bacterium]|nr:MAG: hypothetical protein DRP33_05055 [Thermotogota bacterium]
MEDVIVLRLNDRKIDITTDTPFVVILRDLMYDGDWIAMKEDFRNRKDILTEIEKCELIEEQVALIGSEVYEPVLFEEFSEWLQKKRIPYSFFSHASLSGLYDLALEYADKGFYGTSHSIIKLMLEIDKNYAPAYELWGSLLLEQGKFEEGIRYLDKAIEIDPWLVEAYSSLGEAYYNLGDYKRAASYWEREIEYAPDNRFTYFMIADAYGKMGSYEKAAEILETLLDVDEKSILGMYELSEIYEKLGDSEKKEALEKKILNSKPHYTSDIEAWARIQLKHGNYKVVEEVISELMKTSNMKAHLKLLLIVPYLKQGKVEEAKELLREIKEQNVWYFYGKKELFQEFLSREEMQICGIT